MPASTFSTSSLAEQRDGRQHAVAVQAVRVQQVRT
jgi:hypothetical protein